MIFDNFAKAAFKLIKTVAPSLSPEQFLEDMKADFDPNLSDEQIFQKMMERIKEDKYGFGKDMAEVASYEPEREQSFEELLSEVNRPKLDNDDESLSKSH
jgi:hypothetical protein